MDTNYFGNQQLLVTIQYFIAGKKNHKNFVLIFKKNLIIFGEKKDVNFFTS